MKRFKSKADEGTTLSLVGAIICYVAALAIVVLFIVPGLISLFS